MTLADTGAAYSYDVAVVRPMTAADAAFAAALHESALPHGFFGRLGRPFLQAYYESFIASPHAVAFVADSTAGPAGVLVGTVRNAAHYSWVLRNRGQHLAWRGVIALLARPAQLWLFLRTRVGRYVRGAARLRPTPSRNHREAPSMAGAAFGQPAVLTHVAVSAESRGTGAGGALVAAFLRTAKGARCREAILVTLAGPEGAGPFYRRLGWTLRDTHDDHDGRLLECYRRRL